MRLSSRHGLVGRSRALLALVAGLSVALSGLVSVPGLPSAPSAAAADAVTLFTPTLVHSNGAELRWSRFAGASFDRYEVHRSTAAGFTPSGSTLLTTIRAVEVTRFTDSTAKPATTLRYKVVANSSPSNEVSSLLPAAGTARLTVQPDAARGQSTAMMKVDGQTGCTHAERNFGAGTTMRMGVNTSTSVGRALVKFDLRDIRSALR